MLVKLTDKEIEVPYEVLNGIFGHIVLEVTPEPGSDAVFTPQWSLYPLLFVCKEWYGIAVPKLYSSASVGGTSSSGEGVEDIC